MNVKITKLYGTGDRVRAAEHGAGTVTDLGGFPGWAGVILDKPRPGYVTGQAYYFRLEQVDPIR